MKLISLKCPTCNANLEINSELENVTCNYCGSKIIIEDEKAVKGERIIKTIGKELGKIRSYYSSDEYQKRLEIQHKETIHSLKMAGIVFLGMILFYAIMFIFIKLID